MSDNRNNLFLDKIQISTQVLEKEGQLDGEYSMLLELIHQGFFKDGHEIEKSDRYFNSWRIIREIYAFLQFNKIKELQKKIPEKIERINTIMDKYIDPNKKLTFSELHEADQIIREIISLSGYHEDKTREEEDGWGDFEDDTV